MIGAPTAFVRARTGRPEMGGANPGRASGRTPLSRSRVGPAWATARLTVETSCSPSRSDRARMSPSDVGSRTGAVASTVVSQPSRWQTSDAAPSSVAARSDALRIANREQPCFRRHAHGFAPGERRDTNDPRASRRDLEVARIAAWDGVRARRLAAGCGGNATSVLRRLAWTGVFSAFGAVASIASQRAAAALWRVATGEEPPRTR
jgi:hypothetical protein